MRPIVYEELKVGDEVVTRAGKRARVVCVDRHHYCELPIVCLISDCEEGEKLTSHRKDGTSCTPDRDFDIFLLPKKEYVVVYRNKEGLYEVSPPYCSHTSAMMMAGFNAKILQFVEVREYEVLP